MTFSDVIRTLTNGRAGKRPMWGGYVEKKVTSESGAEVETSDITFVKKDGVTKFVYCMTDGKFVSVPDAKPSLDIELVNAFAADDWIVGNKDDFEIARGSSGEW